jgi:hypothetical protein
MLSMYGPVRDREGATLHITEIVHGSFGFLLEEVDPQGEPLFHTPLKRAADTATDLLGTLSSDNDEVFARALEEMSPRVFASAKSFFQQMRSGEAAARVVTDEAEVFLDAAAIERAYTRLESVEVVEEMITVEGELLGVIPVGGKFEFRAADGRLLRGDVGPIFGEAYLERIHSEHVVGWRWRAVLQIKETRRAGNATQKLTLVDLKDMSE